MANEVEFQALQWAQALPDNRRAEFLSAFQSQKKDRTTVLVLGLFFGTIGVDRFYLGQTGLGVAKLLTFGGCGIWALVDLFLVMGEADKQNAALLQRLQALYAAQPSWGGPSPGWAPNAPMAPYGYGGGGAPPGSPNAPPGGFGPPR